MRSAVTKTYTFLLPKNFQIPRKSAVDGVCYLFAAKKVNQLKGEQIMEETKKTKETYETPVMEIIEIDAEDIIFASTCWCDGGEPE